MVNPLSALREDVKTCLETAGIKAYDYMETRYVPPVALVVPDDNYLEFRGGDRFGTVNVSLQVLLIGPRMSEREATVKFDELVLKALKALDDEFDITSVLSPSEVVVKDAPHFALVIGIEAQVKIDYQEEETNG